MHLAALAIGVAALTASCSSSGHRPTSAASTPASSRSSSASGGAAGTSSSTTVPGAHTVRFEGDVSNDSGYRYHLVYELDLGAIAANGVNDRPGYTTITVAVRGSWSVKNLLADRRAPFGGASSLGDYDEQVNLLSVMALYNHSRSICSSGLGFSLPNRSLCGLRLAIASTADPSQTTDPTNYLAPGGTTSGIVVAADPGSSTDRQLRVFPGISETDAPGILDDLRSGPDATQLEVKSAENPVSWQSPFGRANQTGCAVDYGSLGSEDQILFEGTADGGAGLVQEQC
jgi:hypothetical protein